MRLVSLSDTHTHHRLVNVPEGDIVIFAGDFTNRGKFAEVVDFIGWFKSLPHKWKVMIAGNHELNFSRPNNRGRKLVINTPEITYLENNWTTIEGLKIYGSPVTPMFYDWEFMVDRGAPIARVWNKIPSDTDILVTHGPPIGILDKNLSGVMCGCEELLVRVEEIKPRYHIFGHIHNSYGTYHNGKTLFINASMFGPLSRDINNTTIPAEPIIIDI